MSRGIVRMGKRDRIESDAGLRAFTDAILKLAVGGPSA